MTEDHLQIALDLSRSSLEAGNKLRLKVRGESMLPLLRDGDNVWVEKLPISPLQRGDLLVIEINQEMIVHRLVAVGSRNWQTKGDHVFSVDPEQDPEKIVGRVFAVELVDKRLNLNGATWKFINRCLGSMSYLEARICQWLDRQTKPDLTMKNPYWVKLIFRFTLAFTRLPFELVKYIWR